MDGDEAFPGIQSESKTLAVQGHKEIKSFSASVSLSESLYMAVTALKQLRSASSCEAASEKLILVGVAGPTGAGKTTLASKLSSMIEGTSVISMRDYFRPSKAGRRGQKSRLYCDRASDPASFDIPLLVEHLRRLQRGESVDAPCYDFLSREWGHLRISPPASQILVVEGVCALEDALRALYDLSIFVVGGLYFDLLRRVQHDLGDVKFHASDVFPGIKEFVESNWKHAQLRVRNEAHNILQQKKMFILKVQLDPSKPEPTTEALAKVLDPEQHCVRQESYVDWFMAPPGHTAHAGGGGAAAGDSSSMDPFIKCRLLGAKCFIMFRHWVVEGPFIITPFLNFEVTTATINGLKSLGYRIAVSYKQRTTLVSDSHLTLAVDRVRELGQSFLQVRVQIIRHARTHSVGKYQSCMFLNVWILQIKGDRKESVQAAAEALGLWHRGGSDGGGATPTGGGEGDGGGCVYN